MSSIIVTGSVATDHLMRFPGRFAEHLLADQLDQVSLSFLVDDLVVLRGGVAANIAFGLARFGLRPLLVAAVGHDFTEYRNWLETHGVDCRLLHVSTAAHTARFVCTTDIDMRQIASFYPGAMREAADIDLDAHLRSLPSRPDLVLVGPDVPSAMLRHAAACRRHGIAFAADPSQQLPRMSGPDVLDFIDGASYLLVNEYEMAMLTSKTGLDPAGLGSRVGVVVTTLAARGVRITRRNVDDIVVPAVAAKELVEPTGAGDAFRAGFFSALTWRLPLKRAAQVGCQMAVLVLETVGPQGYRVTTDEFCQRLGESY